MGFMSNIITILTDFGTRDGYVGSVKGVIKKMCPTTEIIDITHDIDPFDIRLGAYTIRNYYNEFPAGTIHLAVVDPGVGGKRKAIILRTNDYQFVGPDNGLFHYVSEMEQFTVLEVLEDKLNMKRISSTFHARDIFAPAAAKLAVGQKAESFCSVLNKINTFEQTGWQKKEDRLIIDPLKADHFGNIIFSLNKSELPDLSDIQSIRFKKFETNQINNYYAAADKGKPLVLWNSLGFLEIGVNQGSAAAYFDFNTENDKLELIFK